MKRGFFLLALLGCVTSFAADLDALRTLCPAGDSVRVQESLTVRGIVISDCRSENMELNPNLSYKKVDETFNQKTAYIQTKDGSCGVRLRFAAPEDNVLQRYDAVELELQGCTLLHEANPDRMTVLHLRSANIQGRTAGVAADVPLKERSIAALSDADVYTFVTIPDAEMVFKGGCFTDVYDNYGLYCPAIHDDPSTHKPYYTVSGRMDGWASLIRDGAGSTLYLLVNSLCPWRRDGNGVPQGVGPLSGIIVHTPMRRYGGDMGRYSIRPVDRKDIKMGRKKGPWKILTGWELDGTQGQQLEFELLGLQSGVWKNGKKGDRVVADVGKTTGFLWTDSDSFIHIGNDLNALDAAQKGTVGNGSVVFKGPTTGWFDFNEEGKAVGSRSVLIEFSTRKLKASELAFSFAWTNGEPNANTCWGFPAEWRVQCSIDGQPWMNLKETATGNEIFMLRSHPWYDTNVEGVGHRKTGYDCGFGMQQRSFRLPSEAIGHEKIFLRIVPATNRIFVLRGNPENESVCDRIITPDNQKARTFLSFGQIMVEYR
ncbi:MAG: hypothetical protein IJU13_05730 [Bacteroidales bacterium]|nr:hypothetical protein [Bacteroidales bacterium]